MKTLEEKLGIEITRTDGEIFQKEVYTGNDNMISYEIVGEKKEIIMKSYFSTKVFSVSAIFMIVELIKLKKEKGLERICLNKIVPKDSQFQVIREMSSIGYKGKFTVNEERVQKIYDFLKKIAIHPSVSKIHLNKGILLKTKTTEYSIMNVKTVDDVEIFTLETLNREGWDTVSFSSFEDVEEEVLKRLKSLEMKEVFERFYARKAEKLAISLGFNSQDAIRKMYQQKNIEEFENAAFFGNVATHKSFVQSRGYGGYYLFAGGYLFGFIEKEQGLGPFDKEKGNIEVMIEKVAAVNKENKYDVVMEIMVRYIEKMEKEKTQNSN